MSERVFQNLKAKHQEEINKFPMAFGFTEKKILEKLEVKTPEEVVMIAGGGCIRKTDRQAYIAMINRHFNERIEAMKDDDYLYQMFLYELLNTEYGLTCDPTDALESCGLTLDEIVGDERVETIFNKACEKCEETTW